jgi:hypothetical protein
MFKIGNIFTKVLGFIKTGCGKLIGLFGKESTTKFIGALKNILTLGGLLSPIWLTLKSFINKIKLGKAFGKKESNVLDDDESVFDRAMSKNKKISDSYEVVKSPVIDDMIREQKKKRKNKNSIITDDLIDNFNKNLTELDTKKRRRKLRLGSAKVANELDKYLKIVKSGKTQFVYRKSILHEYEELNKEYDELCEFIDANYRKLTYDEMKKVSSLRVLMEKTCADILANCRYADYPGCDRKLFPWDLDYGEDLIGWEWDTETEYYPAVEWNQYSWRNESPSDIFITTEDYEDAIEYARAEEAGKDILYDLRKDRRRRLVDVDEFEEEDNIFDTLLMY